MATMPQEATTTRVDDLPESCLSQVIALTSPRDASRCAAVSPFFRDAADSDAVWERFLPPGDYHRAVLTRSSSGRSPPSSKKDAYLRLSDGANVLVDDDGDGDGGGGMAVWLSRGTGARCVALPARKLSLPWDDGEFSWRWTPHPLSSRFAEVAQLLNCTELDIYGRLPATALTPATEYAAYLVFGAAEEGHRGLSFPDQETTVSVDGCTVAAPPSCQQAVCLFPDGPEASKFRGAAVRGDARRPATRQDGWSEMEMGRLYVDEATAPASGEEKEVVARFEVLGWYPKRGLIVESIEFRPV